MMATKIYKTNPLNTHAFEVLHKGLSKFVSPQVADTANLSIHDNPPGIRGTIYDLGVQLLASKIAEDKYPVEFTYQFPSSWWQMLKRDHAPAWFLLRWPVQYTDYIKKKTVHFTRMAEYPKANIALKDEHRLRMEVLGDYEVIKDTVDVTNSISETDYPTFKITKDDDGIRPAGKPNRCFYCNHKVGKKHAIGCVITWEHKKVQLEATVQFDEQVPLHWTEDQILHRFNESTWCAANLEGTFTPEDCGCSRTVVRIKDND